MVGHRAASLSLALPIDDRWVECLFLGFCLRRQPGPFRRRKLRKGVAAPVIDLHIHASYMCNRAPREGGRGRQFAIIQLSAPQGADTAAPRSWERGDCRRSGGRGEQLKRSLRARAGVQDGPRGPPKTPNKCPRRPQEGPKRLRTRPKMGTHRRRKQRTKPKRDTERTKAPPIDFGLQEALQGPPGRTQDGSRRRHEGAQTAEEGPERLSGRSQRASAGSKMFWDVL